ncbi:MAG: ribonucleotide reductase N-terminal alpha domain-containing protein [Actinomycetota bacterium]|nr:ribonucleotide reductase N-terminal alpha domain-containing protein [Actinomycetota bacterium]
MHVVKRDGRKQPVSLDKILHRVTALSHGLDKVEIVNLVQKVVQGVHDNVKTADLDDLAAQTSNAMASRHPQYSKLAARIAVSNLHKQTDPCITSIFPVLSEEVREFVREHKDALNASLVFERDYSYDFFGYKTLERSYLSRNEEDGRIIERPQHLLMRVALGIHAGDLARVLETYDMMSQGLFTHATPTMFNAGTSHPNLASCFLLATTADSISGIFDTVTKCALISKTAGGIGFSVSNVRSQGSLIRSTGGKSAGTPPFLQVFEIGNCVALHTVSLSGKSSCCA